MSVRSDGFSWASHRAGPGVIRSPAKIIAKIKTTILSKGFLIWPSLFSISSAAGNLLPVGPGTSLTAQKAALFRLSCNSLLHISCKMYHLPVLSFMVVLPLTTLILF